MLHFRIIVWPYHTSSVIKKMCHSFGRSALQKNTRLLGDASRSGGSGSSNTLDRETQRDTRKRSTGDA